MSSTRLAVIATFAAAAVVLAASLLYGRITGAADPGGMDAMSIDMDTTGNTAASLGPWDECIVASPGDTVTIDVTAAGIPADYPMLGFQFTLNSPAGVATVVAANPDFLLGSAEGSSILDVSNEVPDSDGIWIGAALDISDYRVVPPESGSGVLERINIRAAAAATAGVYRLTLDEAAHGDRVNDWHPPAHFNSGFIAVNSTCENLPTITPPPPPPNDDFASAVLVGELTFQDSVSTRAASKEPGEPAPCGSTGATVWYSFSPAEDMLLRASLDGSDFDTVLAAYNGESLPDLTVLDCNDDSRLGIISELVVNVSAGQTVFFQAGGFTGGTGTLIFTLELTMPPTPPPCALSEPSGTLQVGVDHDGGFAEIDSGPALVPTGEMRTVCVVLDSVQPVRVYSITVSSDDNVVWADNCVAPDDDRCTVEAPGYVRFYGDSFLGMSGSFAVGGIDFVPTGLPGECTDLIVQALIVDPFGTELSPAVSNGRICISSGATPTPTPTPTSTATPEPTPAPTPTPIALPKTGGGP